jgi:putative SOS response-associated peptidase YedK
MCGRFTIRIPANVLIQHFALHGEMQLALRYNVAPTQQVPIIRHTDNGRELSMMRWGLVPSWADDPKIGYKMINARSEDAATKPSFRAAMKKRRCLIPADGYYEWQAVGKKKQPHHIRRADSQPFAFAGLWETWHKADPPLDSCTILTTAAAKSIEWLHNRMPVILSPGDYDAWLNPAEQDSSKLAYMFEPPSGDELATAAVDPIINNARNEGPDFFKEVQAHDIST